MAAKSNQNAVARPTRARQINDTVNGTSWILSSHNKHDAERAQAATKTRPNSIIQSLNFIQELKKIVTMHLGPRYHPCGHLKASVPSQVIGSEAILERFRSGNTPTSTEVVRLLVPIMLAYKITLTI